MKTRFDDDVLDELGSQGLVRGRELDDDFEATLRLLDEPRTEYYAYTQSPGGACDVLVAWRGKRNAIAVASQDSKVWLMPVRDTDAATTLTRHLPTWPVADFLPFSVPQAEFAEAGDEPIGSPPRRSQEGRDLATLLEQPNHGLGFLHTARTPRGGTREQAPDAVSYLDLDIGRVATDISGPPGNRYVNVFPGDNARIARKLATARAALDS